MTSGTAAVRETARAKINLYLHITGRRPDGMHLLDSLVVFAAAGDVVTVSPGDGLSLKRSGPMAGDLPPVGDDLAARAAALLAAAAGIDAKATIEVEKNLPVGGGIGGGSADAAATLRALVRLWPIDLPPARLHALALRLGADVPVCLASRAARVRGIGEALAPVEGLPRLPAVLVNPRVEVATAAVFAAFAAGKSDLGQRPEFTAAWPDAARPFAQRLAACANDLTAPATSICPVIGQVLAALSAQPDALLARMSGSGATCFALFASAAAAGAAAAALARAQPGWWVVATTLNA